MSRRNLTLIIIFAIIFIILLIILLVIGRGTTDTTSLDIIPWYYSEGYNELAYSEDQKELKKPENILEDKVKTPTLSANEGEIQFYSKVNNKFKSFDLNNDENVELINNAFEYDPLQNILWSPNKDQAHIGSYDSGFSLIDFSKKLADKMSGNIKAIGWSPNGLKIAYQYSNILKEQNDIVISNPDGSNWQKLINLELPNQAVYNSMKIGWYPDGESIYYSYIRYERPGRDYIGIDIESNETFEINYSPESRFANKILYSKDGKKILVSVQNEDRPYYPEIWVMDIDGNNKQYTGIENKIKKCAWMNDSKNIICALSANIQGTGSNDILVKVDLSDMSQTQLTGLGEEAINVKDLLVTADDSTLYFVNSVNENLYKLNID